jgi:putative ABC transport system ATP-binding protein
MENNMRDEIGETPERIIVPGDSDASLIFLREVNKVFKTGSGEVSVLKDINFSVRTAEFVVVEGPSGSGKSTLLNMITGIDRPTSGEVIVTGEPVHDMSENRLASWRGVSVGVIFQFFQLLPTLTILENVILPMDFSNVYHRTERPERAMTLLELVGIADHAHKLPSSMSGGEQQRAAIARALANDPPLLVADEPTGNLDTKTALGMFDLFNSLIEKGKTLLVVTHDLRLSEHASRVALLEDGRIMNGSEKSQ